MSLRSSILSLAQPVLNGGGSSSLSECSIVNESALDAFLNEPSTMMLSIDFDGSQTYTFSSTQGLAVRQSSSANNNGSKGSSQMYLVKLNPTTIDSVTALSTSVVISTVLNSSPLLSLQASLHGVFGPALLNSSQVDEGTRKLIGELDARLTTCVDRDGQSSSSSSSSSTTTSTALVFSLSDECRLWEMISSQQGTKSGGSGGGGRSNISNSSGPSPVTANLFLSILRPLSSRFDALGSDALTLPSALELVADTEESFDRLWNASSSSSSSSNTDFFPEHRIRHLLSCCGAQLANFLQQAGGSLPFWTHSSFTDVRLWLEDAVRLCNEWRAMLVRLTHDLWPGKSQRPSWTGETARDLVLESLGKRLSDLLALRLTHEEIVSLLPMELQQQCGIAEAARPLQRLNAFHIGNTGNSAWDAAVASYERALSSTDTHVARILGEELRRSLDQPHLLLRVLQLYANTLRVRKGAAALLHAERDLIVTKLSSQIGEISTELRRRTNSVLESSSASSGNEKGASSKSSSSNLGGSLSMKVSSISWTFIAKSRAKLICSIAKDLLGASEAKNHDLVETSEAVIDECSRASERMYSSWLTSVEQLLRGGQIALESTGRIMEFDVDGNMRVRYSETLVILLRDVRTIGELGLVIPEKIRSLTVDAEKYYRFAVQLQKVASFYNSLGADIIPSQKALLLRPLLSFERAVQEGAKASGGMSSSSASSSLSNNGVIVTWSEPKQVASFLEDLLKKSDELGAANRRLRRLHSAMCEAVSSLMNDADMLVHRDTLWKEKWASVREIFSQASAPFIKDQSDAVAKWALHWDMQLFKAVEADYRLGLERLSSSVKEIRADIIWNANTRSPAFRPPLEELRDIYYKELRKHVAVPASFAGLTGANAKIFEAMARRNAVSLGRVYHNAEVLFARVAKHRDGLKKWCLIGAYALPDIESFVDQHVKTYADFEAALSGVQIRREALQKANLDQLVNIECVTLSASPLKSSAEAQLTALHDAILVSLFASLSSTLSNIEAFFTKANEILSSRPASMAEIAKAKKEYNTLQSEKGSLGERITLVEKQRVLLSSSAGGLFDLSLITQRISRANSDWDNFNQRLDAFNSVLEEQREALKASVSSEIKTLLEGIDAFIARWSALKPGAENKDWGMESVSSIYGALEDWTSKLQKLTSTATAVKESCESFGLTPPALKGLDDIAADVADTSAMWSIFKSYQAEREKISTQDWVTFRSKLFDLQDFSTKWIEATRGKTKSDIVRTRIFDECDGIKRGFNALKFARGEPFKEEHWSAMFKKLSMPRGVKLETLTVGHFIDAIEAVASNLQWLKDLTSRAQGEVTLRDALQELRAWGETAEFKLLEHVSNVNGRKTSLIKDWKELFTEVGDTQSLLQSLKESAYFKPFADTASVLEQNLSTVDECAQALNSIQRRWVYLEPVFGRGALPAEGARFRRVDEQFREIMTKVTSDPKVLNLADAALHGSNLKERLVTMVDQLERCQKALADFLEEKRSRMPRFYFIGDDDLLEILGQAQSPAVIQSHLKKLYQGVYRVLFSNNPKSKGGEKAGSVNEGGGSDEKASFITAMCSVSGEIVPLDNAIAITDDVTHWLAAFTQEMCSSLASLTVACVKAAKGGEGWEARLQKFPSQVLCLCELVLFTEEVERILSAGQKAAAGEINANLAALRSKLTHQLASYTSKTPPDNLSSLKIKALVLDIIHNLDVVEVLSTRDVKDTGSWHWQKQLRFYLSPNGRCTVRMVNASIEYTYEYQGNAPKLVHTPLTDKCYLTLTQGLTMGYGGNPYGPAGTGKTESVKALGAAVGRQVLVFNCDEAIDHLSFGRLFTGLVKCGAWGCFDEFNRLKADQLSAVSQQIQVIQAAIKERSSTVSLLGRPIDVNANAGIFVTLNPAGKGYGGRSRLPDNLKALFRPVAMSKPDNELIAEVVLYSEGFMSAKELGRKMVSLFTVSSQMLSPQQHYDWGLRAMKACLTTGGGLISAARSAANSQRLSAEAERELLIKAVRVNTLSKLTFDDAARFVALIGDIFPGSRSDDISDEALETAIRKVISNKPFNLEFDQGQLRKMLQLKEALGQRMGCVIVGPSGCGKSTLWRVLQSALISLGQPVITHVMNPKAMPRARLLGEMDPDTRTWTDGVLTTAARQVVKEPLSTRSWIVCDGDVDPEWIESLNSVLDDNHLLTLPNGERISFNSNVNFIFETHDLTFASPATISRMGMIFLSDGDVDVKRIARSWLASQQSIAATTTSTGAPSSLSLLATWIDDFFFKAVEWVRRAPKGLVVETTLVGTVLNGLSQLSSQISKATPPSGSGGGGGGHVISSKLDFCVMLVRGLGGNLDIESRVQFARDVFSWANERFVDSNMPLDTYVDMNGAAKSFVTTTALSSSSPLLMDDDGGSSSSSTQTGYSSSVVSTVTFQRIAAIVSPWLDRMEPFIIVGPSGCGKSTLITHLISQRKTTSITTLHCNAQTTADHVIQKLRQSCGLFSANTGRVFRPREGDRLVLFLKDINLPKPDRYNTCGLIAFLQQLLTFKGFYDEHLEFLAIERVHIVCTMNPATTVGRHQLSTRFTATVRIAAMDYPDSGELVAISNHFLFQSLSTTSVLDDRFKISSASSSTSSNPSLLKLSTTMVDIYSQSRSTFSIDEQRHYLFTPRDLISWVRALQRYPLSAEKSLLDTVAYEANRVFRDRLVSSDALQRFDVILSSTIKKVWGVAPPDLRDTCFSALGAMRSSSSSSTSNAQESPSSTAERDSSSSKNTSSSTDASINASLVGAPLSRFDVNGVRALAERGLVLYEREERDLSLILFPEAIDRFLQIDRVLTKSGGSLLLVGRSGIGRRSLATLVAFMHGMKWVSPTPLSTVPVASKSGSSSSAMKSFYGELKTAFASAGVDGDETVLFVEDHQLGGGGDSSHNTEDFVLEALNSVLSSGEVPGLYTHEELEQLLIPIKTAMSADASNRYKTPYDCFVSRVRSKLHVVLSLDPTHPLFKLRCEQNPALFSRCAIIWYGSNWRQDSMQLVAQQSVGDVLEQASKHISPQDLVSHALSIHASMSATDGNDNLTKSNSQIMDATPRSFVSLLKCFKGIYFSRAGRLQSDASRLRSGLSKLLEAQGTVDELSKNANAQRVQLKEKQALADAAMTEIADALAGASDRRREVEGLQKKVASADGEARQRKSMIENELSDIQPVLDEAKAAVGGIRKDNLDEIRALKMPPEAIADVLSAVLLLLGIEDTSWNSMKKFLSGRGVIQDILNYDAHSLSTETRAEVAKVMKAKAESFKHENIYRASVAAAPLAAWVKANVKYAQVLEKIAPLEQDLKSAAGDVQRCAVELQAAKAELDVTDAKVQQLKVSLGKRTAEAESLREALARTEDTLSRAQSLLGQLSGEKERWEKTVAELGNREAQCSLQSLLAAGFVTYLTESSEDAREQAISTWTSILLDSSAGSNKGGGGNIGKKGASSSASMGGSRGLSGILKFDVLRFLSSESEMLTWRSNGLPADELSLQNAVSIFVSSEHSQRVPLLIDPSSQATNWLQKFFESSSSSSSSSSSTSSKGGPFEVVTAQDARFANQFELAVRFGKTLLIKEADRIDPLLYPLLRRDFTHQGPRLVVQVGDRVVDYNEKFKLFLATRCPQPNLPPDARALISSVNFTVTRSGLEGQLLGIILKHEEPELESQKSQLLRQEEDLKVTVTECEEDLLSSLANSKGSLLDNAQLLASLASTKAKSEEVNKALAGSARASEVLDAQRELYRPFATAGARLFFTLGPLSTANHMYQFGLSFFFDLFKATLEEGSNSSSSSIMGGGGGGKNSVNNTARLVPLLEAKVLLTVGRSLLKSDRLTFALFLVNSMKPELFGDSSSPSFSSNENKSNVSTAEWSYLMGEAAAPPSSSTSITDKSGIPLWLPADREGAFRDLSSSFPLWVTNLDLGQSDKWARWIRSPTPERDFPPAAIKSTSAWQRVLLVQSLRPDRTISALQSFICETLNVSSITPPAVNLEKIAAEAAGRSIHSSSTNSKDTTTKNKNSETSTCATPILMITTSGADPSRELSEFAASSVGSDRYTEIAMGGGQQEIALRALRKAANDGDWLCLKNLHLVVSWLPTLEKELNTLRSSSSSGGGGGGGKVHVQFRLWLTTECHDAFPPELLQNSVKVAYEAPPGLKKNTERTYESWSTEYIGSGSPLRAQALFLLAWFHGIVQERRTYVPQGWTKAYEFSFADLRAGANVIDTLLSPSGPGLPAPERVPWAYLHGLLEHAVYGGRVDTLSDIRILRAFLAQVFHPEVLAGRRPIGRGIGSIPLSTRRDDFLSIIQALPDADQPHLFALPDNIERSAQRATFLQVIASLKALRVPLSISGGAFDRDLWSTRLTPILDLCDKLFGAEASIITSATLDDTTKEGGGGGGKGGSIDPLSAFLQRELSLSKILISVALKHTSGLKKVLSGTSFLTPAIQITATSLLVDTTPESWLSAGWPDGPDSASAWLRGLASRRSMLLKWSSGGADAFSNAILGGSGSINNSNSLRLKDVFLPGTFLNAIRQLTARRLLESVSSKEKETSSMDSLKLTCAWDKRLLAKAPIVISIAGLLLQGAALDPGRCQLTEALLDASEVQVVPELHIAWVPPSFTEPYAAAEGADPSTATPTVPVPLFYSLDREKLLTELQLPCSGEKAKWVLNGVALLIEDR